MKKFLAMALCIMMVLTVASFAIELDVAETVTEADASVEAVLSNTTERTGKYGVILVEDNGVLDEIYKDASFANQTYRIVDNGTCTLERTTSPTDGLTPVIKASTASNSGFRQPAFNFGGGFVPNSGRYTAEFDMYIPTQYTADGATQSKPSLFFLRVFPMKNDGTSSVYCDSVGKEDAYGKWTHVKFEFFIEKTADGKALMTVYDFVNKKNLPQYELTNGRVIEIKPIAQNLGEYYFTNFRFSYMSNNAVSFANGEEYGLMNITGDTFTFPKLSDVNPGWADYTDNGMYVWASGNKTYLPGQVVDASAVAGQSFESVEITASLYDKNYGELVVLMDFENVANENDYYATKFINNSLATGAPSGMQQFLNLKSARVIDDGTGTGNKAMRLTTANTAGNNAFRWVAFKGLSMNKPGEYSMQADVMLAEGVDPVNDLATGGNRGFIGFAVPRIDIGFNAHEFDAGKWYTVSGSAGNKTDYFDSFGVAIQMRSADTLLGADLYWIDNLKVYYKDTAAVYLTATADERFIATKSAITGDTYTFPAHTVLGEAQAAFDYWTNGEILYAVGETVNKSVVAGKNFYPSDISTLKPAVIFNYEGDRMLSTGLGSDNTYVELINDEGRTVLHSHSWNKIAKRDKRIHFKAEKYDPKEYSILQFMSKYDNTAKVVGDSYGLDTTPHCIYAYFHYNAAGEYYKKFEDDAIINYRVGNTDVPYGAGYVLYEFDSRSVSLMPGYDIGYGVSVDLANGTDTRWGHDIYLDYIRMYRNGSLTVTYNTNAPAGATVVKEVAPDNNRGMGTGYLLKGERPEVEGYTFVGWALSENATKDDVIESFDLLTNTTVYAVWEANADIKVPDVEETVEIKGTGTANGIRFKSKIFPSVKANLEEIGFIATRKTLLPVIDGAVNTDALTFLLKKDGANKNAYVTGVAYDKDGGIDIVNSEDADGNVIYTAVMTGIPLANKTETMYMRAYNKANIGGKEIVTYGPVSQISLYDVALAIKTAGGEAYESNKAYIDSIVG